MLEEQLVEALQPLKADLTAFPLKKTRFLEGSKWRLRSSMEHLAIAWVTLETPSGLPQVNADENYR